MSSALRVTPAEFEILEVLWEAGRPLPVSLVLKELRLRRTIAYTSVMTLLNRLFGKQTVTRQKQGRAYLYLPAVQRDAVLENAVEDFARAYFSGQRIRLEEFLGVGLGPQKSTPETPAAEDMDVVLL